MILRPLLLSALCLGLVAGCAKQSPAPENTMPPTDSKTPTQPETPSGGTTNGAGAQGQPEAYIIRNSGIRCIAPPCPTHLAVPVANPGQDAIQIHEIDFSAMNPSEEKREEYMAKADTDPNGLKVEAVLDKQTNAGPAGDATVLRVRKILP
jgi:hypothetical protein